MDEFTNKNINGFSLVELLVSMTITLILMTIAGTIFHQSIGTRERETRRTEAIVAAQSGLNLISREIANTGFGLTDNGIVAADSNAHSIHFRSNIKNNDAATNAPGEDLTYYFEPNSQSIIRYDRFDTPQTANVISRASNLTFQYFDYTGFAQPPASGDTPSSRTMRVKISVTVFLEAVAGQPDNQEITYSSEVSLRNSKYISINY